MTGNSAQRWTFLSTHGQVLVWIARDGGIRLRDLGDRVGITERAAHRIVTELSAAGYITRQKNGRRNQYEINLDLPLPDPLGTEQSIGELIEILAEAAAL